MNSERLAVLVVDDALVIQDVLRECLEADSYVVTTAAKSLDLIPPLCADPPGLLVLDLRLTQPCPGWTIIGALRSLPETRSLPLVAMTTDRSITAEQAAMLRALRVVLLHKPVLLDDLAAAIAAAQELVYQSRALGE